MPTVKTDKDMVIEYAIKKLRAAGLPRKIPNYYINTVLEVYGKKDPREPAITLAANIYTYEPVCERFVDIISTVYAVHEPELKELRKNARCN